MLDITVVCTDNLWEGTIALPDTNNTIVDHQGHAFPKFGEINTPMSVDCVVGFRYTFLTVDRFHLKRFDDVRQNINFTSKSYIFVID